MPLLINPAIPKGLGIKYNYADTTILRLSSIKIVYMFKEYGAHCVSVNHVYGSQRKHRQVKKTGAFFKAKTFSDLFLARWKVMLNLSQYR